VDLVFNGTTILNNFVNGTLTFLSEAKIEGDLVVNGTVFANYFNGDGSAIKNIQAGAIVGTVAQANSSFYADEASKVTGYVNGAEISNSTILNNTVNGTLELQSEAGFVGDMFVNGTISAKSIKAQQLFALANSNISVLSANASNNGSFVKMTIPNPEGWSEFRLDDEAQNHKWSVGSLGDQRSDNNGGKNTFYIYQYKDQNDQAVNSYRLAITDTGKVGIGGLTNPSEALEVVGNVKADNFIGNISATNIVGVVDNAENALKVTGYVNGAEISNSTILNNTVNGTLELQSEAGFVGDINLNGNLHFAKGGFSVGLSNRNVSWDGLGTLIQDTGWIDFIADSNNDNDNIGFRFFSHTREVPKIIAAILENGVEINKPLKVEGGHLTLKDGTQAEGKILSSVTNNGLASWVDPNEIYPGQWKLVHVENFDNATTLTNWHIGSQNADLLTDCGGESILGGYNKAGENKFLEKSFNLAGIPHNEVKITYELYSIDSWDENEGAWLEINGKRFSNSYSWHYVRNRKQVCGREGASILWNDGISFEEIQTSSTNGQLDLKFGAYLNEALNNESFGIDNLRIYVRTVDESVSLPEVAYTPPPARYYQANAKNCTNWCTSQGMTNLADPQGFYCASGEAKSVTAINQKDEGKFIFTYGCWSDGNCTEGQNSGSGASENGYCYKLGQKKDYDATDITVACYCQPN
jgi:hypothetical protein